MGNIFEFKARGDKKMRGQPTENPHEETTIQTFGQGMKDVVVLNPVVGYSLEEHKTVLKALKGIQSFAFEQIEDLSADTPSLEFAEDVKRILDRWHAILNAIEVIEVINQRTSEQNSA